MLQALEEDSDLYQIKFKAYKEISAMRAEVEKVLQEQRLEKIKREYEKQKKDDDKSLK
jgi:hypothetical protein